MKKTAQTTVNHFIRTALNMSCDQYVMAMIIYEHNQLRTTSMTYIDYYDAGGFTGTEVNELLATLIERGILIKGPSGRPELSDKWLQYFHQDLQADFKEFWAIESKGSKAKAEQQYMKCRKFIDKDTLHDAYRNYLKWAEALDRFKQDTCTWLNPSSRSWDEDYTIPKEADKTKTSIGSFF